MLHVGLGTIAQSAITAVARPEEWANLCDLVAEAFGANAFMVFEYDFGDFSAPKLHGSRKVREFGAGLVEATLTGTVPDEEIEGYAKFARFPRMRLFSESQIHGLAHDSELPANPYRDAVLNVSGARSRNVARLNDIGPWSDVAALHLPCFGADVDPALRSDVEQVLPILGTSLEAARTVRGLIGLANSLLDAFDQLEFGAAICRPDGRILVANTALRSVASERDGLIFLDGRVCTTHSEDRAPLAEMLKAGTSPTHHPRRGIARLSRRPGRLPLLCRALPISGSEVTRPGETLTFLVVIDPEAPDRLEAGGIGALGLLTPAEIDVCQLIVRGLSTAKIADARGTSSETAKDQVKSALSKLSCENRVDIVRLAMATKVPGRN